MQERFIALSTGGGAVNSGQILLLGLGLGRRPPDWDMGALGRKISV